MISVVVPVTNKAEFQRNILASPELQEMQIVQYWGATSAADAYESGIKFSNQPWILFPHQDVYFPDGSIKAIREILQEIPETECEHTIIGFCGLGPGPAGTVIDRGKLLDWPATKTATSIDELCILMHRTCRYRIDARLGWHLWATDLCVQAMCDGHYARIVRVRLHHNSTLVDIPQEFYASSKILQAKYPGRKVFSLNGI